MSVIHKFLFFFSLQRVHGGPLYVIRYNPDQPRGLTERKLQEFTQYLRDILHGQFMKASSSIGGLRVEYHGYTKGRVKLLNREMFETQARAEGSLQNDDIRERLQEFSNDMVETLKDQKEDANALLSLSSLSCEGQVE